MFGFMLCIHYGTMEPGDLHMDPFQMMLACIFTVTLVASRLTAYLHKFTDSYLISLGLPAFISILQVLTSGSDITLIEIVANYISVFFAY